MKSCSLTNCSLPARVLVQFAFPLDDSEHPYHAYCATHSGVWKPFQVNDVELVRPTT